MSSIVYVPRYKGFLDKNLIKIDSTTRHTPGG